MIQSTKELYDRMLDTPNLCGRFELVDKTIFWELFDGFDIEISIEPPDNYFSISKKPFWIIPDYITHWHPDEEDIYEQVCDMGLKGNVLVIRASWLGAKILYRGKEEDCPISPSRKWSWGKIYYLRAE